MNARLAGILVLLLAILGGAALLSQRQEASREPRSGTALGQPLLKNLKAADIAAIRIAEPAATLTLQRKDAGWTIAERGDFPASLASVRDFVLKAIELKAGQSEPIGEKDRARLRVDGTGTQVEFLGADGKPLARMIVGKKYFKRDPDDPEKVPGDGRFVLLPEAPDRVYVVADPLAQASTQSRDWVDRTAFKVEKVGTLELRFPDGGDWRIERSADNADWKLAAARPGEKLDTSRANAASYMLGQLELADVAAPAVAEKPAQTGLDKPVLIRATTLTGAAWTIRVGKLMGEDFFVSFEPPAGADARDKQLARYVLLVPKSKLEDTLKKRDEILEKKQDTKK
jgi:hypothetical protein